MIKKSVSDFIKLGDEIKAYNNGMFLTVNYSVTVPAGKTKICDKCGHGGFPKSKEEYRFQLVLRDIEYKRIKHWFFEDDRFSSEALTKEFKMSEIKECRKFWLEVRDKPLTEPEWVRW